MSDQAHTRQPTAGFTRSHTYHTFHTTIYIYVYVYVLSVVASFRSFDCPEFDRCSFDEEVHIVYGLKLKFHRCSVNFEVDHRLLGRRACVVLRT